MAEINNEVSITLSVREWLSRIDCKLDTKADKSDIIATVEKVEKLDLRVRRLEDEQIRIATERRTNESKSQEDFAKKDNKKTNIALIGGIISFLAVVGDVLSRIKTS